MWGSFCLAVAATLALLLVPGFLTLRGMGFSRLESALAAPLPTMLLCAVLSAAFYKAGLFCTWWLLAVTCIVVALVVFALGKRFGCGPVAAGPAGGGAGGPGVAAGTACAHKGTCPPALARFAAGPWCVLLYIAAAALVYCYMFVLNADDASSCVQYYDNMHHLGSIQSSLVTGNWSSFDTTSYPDQVAGGAAPTSSRFGFYPSAWHCIASFAASLTACEVEVAENATLAVFCVVVFPSGMYLLLRKLFSDKPLACVAGAVCAVAFAFYPWRFMTFGPLLPNLVSLSLLPSAAAAFLGIFEEGASRKRRGACAALFVVGLGALAFTQPNVVFALGIFLAPYLVLLASRIPLRLNVSAKAAWRVVAALAAAACIAAVWVACNKAPFMQSVVNFVWDPYVPTSSAIKDVLLTRYLYHPAQIALSLLIFAGVVAAIADRRRAWVVAPFAIAACLYVVAASMEGPIRHLLTGFWYTDPTRIISMVVIFAMPLAALGFSALVEAASALAGRLRRSSRAGGTLGARWYACTAGVLAVVVCVWNFWPNYYLTGEEDSQNAFDVAGLYMREAFNDSYNAWYDRAEREFVSEAMAIVGTDEVLANIPGDGSAVSYGINGCSVLYRYYDEAGSESELEASRQIRLHLNEVASSPEVAAAARELNVGYVLKLHFNGIEGLAHSGAENWQGLFAIDDDTPGFEVVLAEGDMRLYRITAA